MNLQNARVSLTGASGGIGRAVARELVLNGAQVCVSGRDQLALNDLAADLRSLGGNADVVTGDLLQADGPEALAAGLMAAGVPDAVVCCAGQLGFGPFESMTPEQIEQLWRINVTAPMRLARALIPAMRARGSGRLLFVGSIFGSIGFPYYSVYSASKFALRGFAEALRRELDGSGVGVSYVAPRYTKTGFNQGAAARIAEAMKMNQDEPAVVATQVVRALREDRAELFLGGAERFFVRLNGLLPRLVDGSLIQQGKQIRALLQPSAPTVPTQTQTAEVHHA